ncbi:MAG: hypothetical protein ONB14_06675 [candidate division KSB1 bacterium]|nr:hypothetical protein [candidate division KSB1 bacterium]MDZ7391621.1 hypothetical protein [candidate division KSB1 bacterium]
MTSETKFIACAKERALCYAALFTLLALARLTTRQGRFHNCRLHTGNGSEFIGARNAREQSPFTTTVHSFAGVTHTTIPAGAHTWQTGVETVHRLIEREFHKSQFFRSRQEFLAKAAAYAWWFRLAREDSHKGNRAPWETIQKRSPCQALAALTPFCFPGLSLPVHPRSQKGLRC